VNLGETSFSCIIFNAVWVDRYWVSDCGDETRRFECETSHLLWYRANAGCRSKYRIRQGDYQFNPFSVTLDRGSPSSKPVALVRLICIGILVWPKVCGKHSRSSRQKAAKEVWWLGNSCPSPLWGGHVALQRKLDSRWSNSRAVSATAAFGNSSTECAQFGRWHQSIQFSTVTALLEPFLYTLLPGVVGREHRRQLERSSMEGWTGGRGQRAWSV